MPNLMLPGVTHNLISLCLSLGLYLCVYIVVRAACRVKRGWKRALAVALVILGFAALLKVPVAVGLLAYPFSFVERVVWPRLRG